MEQEQKQVYSVLLGCWDEVQRGELSKAEYEKRVMECKFCGLLTVEMKDALLEHTK